MVCRSLGVCAQAPEPAGQAEGTRRAIVVLEGQPLATGGRYAAGRATRSAPHDDEQAHLNDEMADQNVRRLHPDDCTPGAAAEAALAERLPDARVERRYREVLNGLAITLPEAAWPALQHLAGQAGIRAVFEEETTRPALYASVDVMGATALWPSLGGRDNAGSGVRIAVVDSGIRVDHPMFSAAGLHYPSGFPKGDSRYTTAKVIAARAYFRPGDAPLASETTPVPGAGGSAHGTTLASVAAGRQVQATYRGPHPGHLGRGARRLLDELSHLLPHRQRARRSGLHR